MDPNLVKFLEEDEDESNLSGADVDAFTAALNRDIEGGDAPTSQPSDSDNATISHGSNLTSNELLGQLQSSSQEENITNQHGEEHHHLHQQEQHSSDVQLLQHGSGAENQSQQTGSVMERDQPLLQRKQSENDQQNQQAEQNAVQSSGKDHNQISEQNPVQLPDQDRFQHSEGQRQNSKLPASNNQPVTAVDQAKNTMRRNKPIPSISFGTLIPILRPHLDKDKQMQLQTVFGQLKRNEVNKEDFLRVVRNIVGDHMLRMAAMKVQEHAQAQAARNSQATQLQHQLQSQSSSQQLSMPSSSAQQSQFFPQHQSISPAQHQKGHGSSVDQSQVPSSTVQTQTSENNVSKARETENPSDVQGHISQMASTSMNTNEEREHPLVPVQTVHKQQQNLHLPQASFSMYGGQVTNYNPHPYSGPSVSVTASSLKPLTQDSQIRQVSHMQGVVSSQLGVMQPTNLMNMPKHEVQNATNETKRLQGGSLPHIPSHSSLQQNTIPWQSSLSKEQGAGVSSMGFPKQEQVDQMADKQHKPQMTAPQRSSTFGAIHNSPVNPPQGHLKDEQQSARLGFPPSTSMIATNQNSSSMATQVESSMQMRYQIPPSTTPVGPGTNARTPPKKPSVGQKKPLEALGTPSPLSSKKQKVSGGGALLDQSIEQLNDVTAVSGVNLREEEEQLLSAPKEESRASEATRRVVQEEEERLILQRGPLQKKVAEIMSKCGIKSTSNDVERCLSMCVEERMRGLINNLIRLSKQRVDIEKPRHRVFLTSDIKRQILVMNRKAKEDWEKKQAEEAEKLRKLNEAEGGTGVDTDKDKDKEDGRLKALKANKEEDDKMRTTAANVAARAAVGGDDMLSKWQLMAEQARQKREGGVDGTSSVQPVKDPSRRPLSSSLKNMRESQEAENKGSSTAAASTGGWQANIIHPVSAGTSIGQNMNGVARCESQSSHKQLLTQYY